MATSKQIRISIISALNAAGIEATKNQVDSMAKSVAKSMGDAAKSNRKHWADIKAAWDMALGAIRKIGGFIRDAIKKAFDAEYALANFSTLLGSIDKAKEHIAELKQFAASTPLTFGDLSQASKTLLAFGADVKTVMPSLRMLGDISLGNAEKMQSLSLAFGKIMSEGRLTGVTLKQMVMAGFNPLVEISQKTGASMDELKDMMEKGSISFDLVSAAIRSATSEGGRFHKAMETASKTGSGMMSTLSDNWTAAVTTFGQAFSNAAKEGIGKMNTKLKQLLKDGTIELWANKTVKVLNDVVKAAKGVAHALKWVWEKSGASDVYNMGRGFISASGYTIARAASGIYYGEGVKNSLKASIKEGSEVYARESIKGYWGNRLARGGYLGRGGTYLVNANDEQAARDRWEDEQIKKAYRDKRKPKGGGSGEPKGGGSGEENRKVTQELTVEQAFAAEKRKLEEAAAKKAAEKRAEEEKKAAEKAAKERERLDAQEAVRRERERQAELAAQIKEHQKLLAAERAEESKSRSAVSAAESKLQQAWGWYRDKDSMAAQLAEEKADAEARKQFEKDFARLKDRRRDWRKAENLSVDDEAVRRVALAREEKEAAEKHLAEIEKNTADLAAKLDELLEVKG